jgi:hypothetical protein
MAWFRRKKTSSGPQWRPWLDHGLSGGERVDCVRCGRGLTVVLQASSSVLVTHDGMLDGAALICTGCGKFTCEACSLLRGSYLAKCPECADPVVPPMT